MAQTINGPAGMDSLESRTCFLWVSKKARKETCIIKNENNSYKGMLSLERLTKLDITFFITAEYDQPLFVSEGTPVVRKKSIFEFYNTVKNTYFKIKN